MEQSSANRQSADAISDEDIRNRVSFILFIVPAFARAFKMNPQKAYFYLKDFGGFDFLLQHWWTLHVEDPFWAVRSLFDVCFKNGGRIEQYHYEGVSRK